MVNAMKTETSSRRRFLRNGMTLSGMALAAARLGLATGADKVGGKIRLGVASYSFHKFDRAHVIDFMKQLDVKYLNAKDVLDHLPMKPPEATEAAVAAYKAVGIELTAAGVIYFAKPDEADIREKFEYVRRAGVRLIAGSPTREALPMVEKFVKEYDFKLAIHNHGPEDKQWPSPLDILKVIEPMDHRIGLCIDVGHTARAGTDPVEAIHKAGKRLYDVHIKDLADLMVKESQVAVGEGKMPIRGIFEALIAVGYGGFVDLEYEIHEDDPLPGMMKSFAFMRKVLLTMEIRAEYPHWIDQTMVGPVPSR